MQVGDTTLDELAKYSGHDPTRPILFAVRGRIFDVTESRGFYGPGALLLHANAGQCSSTAAK